MSDNYPLDNAELTPDTREEHFLDGATDLEPETRKEAFIAKIYDSSQVVPEHIETREEWFLNKAAEGGGGVTIEALSVTENGIYSEIGKAYSPVTVNVPLPTNANERKSVTSYPVTDSANYPLPKCDVTVTDADKCEVIVTTDNVITEDSGVYIDRQSGGGNRELDEIVGGSIVFNQLVKETDTSCTVQSGHKYVLKQGSTYTVVISDGTAFTVDGSVNDNVYDLTAVFGSTIADYVYSLEQSTAGSGIAWLRSYGYLTEDYYGYTANKIESVCVSKHVMKDSNDSVIGSYAINPITLRGVPKLNASNQLYYDGDIYEASGRVTRKYGIVDLGTLPWAYVSGDNSRFTAALAGVKTVATPADIANIICEKYIADSVNSIYAHSSDKIIGVHNTISEIWCYDSAYTDAATFKTAMSGVYLVYELATPTTESADAYQNPQRAYPDGTEEFIDYGVSQSTRDVAIPVGNNSDYTINEVIEPIADYVDNIPIMCKETTPGTYTLTATVDANGNVTYAWA